MDLLRRLAAALDRPSLPWKTILIGFSVGQYVFENFLAFRQYRVLQRSKPPKVLEDEVDQATFDKSQAYGRAKARYGFVAGLYDLALNVSFIRFDAYLKMWTFAGAALVKFAPAAWHGEITQSIVFFAVFNLLSTVLGLPTSYYHTFILEEKFGFNKQTLGLWITDKLKSQGLSIVLGGPILAAFLTIVRRTGNVFFYYIWVFAVLVQMFFITIYPIVIVPLFNKLSPLEEGKLKTQVETLAKRLKFPLNELYVIDGSKRSAHSNAYFFGLPWKKHIVIYDTLIEKSEPEEVVAVLGHELGHWSLSHTTKLMGISQFHIFYIFVLFSAFIQNKSLYSSFGFRREMPIMIGFILFNDALAPMDMLIKLGMNVLTRRYEFQADQFAKNLGYSRDLAHSLIKLQIQNLSTMDTDWAYGAYHFSHPILAERLGALGWYQEKAKADKSTKASQKDGVVKAEDREL